MKVYQILIEHRKGGASVSNIYGTRAAAIEALKKIADYENDEFGGKLDEGTYYTEEESYVVIEKEMAEPKPVFSNVDFAFEVEDCRGERKMINMSQFHATGIAPDWATAKDQVEKYGSSALGLVGYFRTPDGVLASSSRFQYYLDKEKGL